LLIAYWTSTTDCERYSAVPNNPMKAIVYCEYGSPDVLKFEDVEKPVPNDNQILIKVRAASLNAFDVYVIRDAWLGRLIFGLRKPRDPRLGRDVARMVGAVGKNVPQFKPGDEVFGICREALVCNHSFTEGRRVLTPKGICILAGMGGAGMLGDLIQAGKLRPVIEQTYKLNDAPEALRDLDGGHARGKVVITVEGDNKI
jgi:NADPH:quinone reductase-like Zn-dependent oxidoreductase